VSGGLADGGLDAVVGAAAADVADHRFFNLLVAGVRVGLEQRCRRHDLPTLAETALGDRRVEPGLLDDFADWIGMQVVDGADILTDDGTDGRDATACRSPFDMNGAGPAQAHAAAEFGAVVTGYVADRPEQRHVLGDVELMVLTIELQGNHVHARMDLE